MTPPPNPSPIESNILRRTPSVTQLLKLLLGVSQRVTRKAYAICGFALMLLKYTVEASVVWALTASEYWPWDFLNPLLSARTETLRHGPEWLPWAWFLWTLPFLWIAVSMSVRRAADAGSSPWMGLMVLVPVVNLVVMLILCFLPSAPGEHWSPGAITSSERDRVRSAALAIGLSLVIGGVMVWIGVYLLASYGASMFLGTPLLMGAIAAYQYNNPFARSYPASAVVGVCSVFFGGLALLVFALEGVMCVAMAVPLLLPIGALGGVMGKAIADATRRPQAEFITTIMVLPLLMTGESLLVKSNEFIALTVVEIDAPPSVVWNNVVDFPELTGPRSWYFDWGIACPVRARMVGQGPGAIRYCEFTTGSFVEPITAWQEPYRLAFDVTDQPAPLFELSPYGDLHAPHLDGFLRSTRGEFRLIGLPDGRTRLEGRTWYRLEMYPQWYWTLWSDLLIHRIHDRVLLHIKGLSEASSSAL